MKSLKKLRTHKKKIAYVDLDGVAANFDKHRHLLGKRDPLRQECQTPQGYFLNLELMDGVVEAIKELSEIYDVYFLSTPQWSNVHSWTEKRVWVEQHFGELMFKRLILSHHKHLNKGDYLIDDNVHEGFEGKHIHFGTAEFPDWKTVVKFLKEENEKEKAAKIEQPFSS